MQKIETVEELEALYGAPVQRALDKVVDHLTPLYRRWIEASRFVILSTVGADGTDASPRGDDGPVVRIVDDKTVLLPDWRGNNRLDSLHNIVVDGRASLLFMIPGSLNVVRVNGRADLIIDPAVTQSFVQNGKTPKSVVQIKVTEVYFQCAKALMRSGLWSRGDESDGLPTAGDFAQEVDEAFDGENYDLNYADYAKERMW